MDHNVEELEENKIQPFQPISIEELKEYKHLIEWIIYQDSHADKLLSNGWNDDQDTKDTVRFELFRRLLMSRQSSNTDSNNISDSVITSANEIVLEQDANSQHIGELESSPERLNEQIFMIRSQREHECFRNEKVTLCLKMLDYMFTESQVVTTALEYWRQEEPRVANTRVKAVDWKSILHIARRKFKLTDNDISHDFEMQFMMRYLESLVPEEALSSQEDRQEPQSHQS